MSRAPEATRSRLIAAATAEIRKIGPRRMTVLHVANGLGMSHANVYRHFPDKTGLIDAVLNGWLKGLEQRLGEIVEGPDPADDKLERYFATLSRAYAETLRDDPAIFRLLAEPESDARSRQGIASASRSRWAHRGGGDFDPIVCGKRGAARGATRAGSGPSLRGCPRGSAHR